MSISRIYCLFLSLTFVSAVVMGCNSSSSTSSHEQDHMHAMESSDEMNAEVTAALAELSAEDRVLAEAQRFCAVEQENLLGGMGTPFKVMIEGQPVFLCCEGCKDAALKDPQTTLAAVAKLKQANSSAK